MPTPAPLQVVSGYATKVPAVQVSSGVADADKVVATGSNGLLDRSLLPNDPATQMTASENISAGDLVNIWLDGATSKVRKADASGGVAKKADGFAPDAIAGMQLQSRHRPYTGTGFGDWSDWAEVPTEDPDAPAA